MTSIFLKNGRKISISSAPYFIAEMNTSHFGDISVAKDMIIAAKDAGAHCVKFQSWSSDSLYSEQYYNENPIAKRFVNKFSIAEADIIELANFSRENDVDFSSTPYSLEEARFLVEECDVPFVKIASMELNNHFFLEELAELEAPLILSTGMGTMDEINDAVTLLDERGVEDLVILHCVSIYPSDPEIINLQNITALSQKFTKFPIGFSDHSLGSGVPTAAIALGASVIEKHFTLDKSQIGMDNGMASEPDEFRVMVECCNQAYQALGTMERRLSDQEINMAQKMRRSAVCKMDIEEGAKVSLNNVEFKRPGDGISVRDFPSVIGKTTNKRKVKGEVIYPSDLS